MIALDFVRGFAVCLLVIGLLPNSGFSKDRPDLPREEILERARQSEVIQELYEVHPHAEAEIVFSERFGCWVIEFLADGREVGMATVSADGSEVLEASFRDNNRGDERGQRDDREPGIGILDVLKPGLQNSGLFWLSVVILLITLFDFGNLKNVRNFDLLSLLLLAPFLFLIWQRTRFAYTGIICVTLYWIGRCLYAAWKPSADSPRSNLQARPLTALLLLAFLFHIQIITQRSVDDFGIWGTFGAQHFIANTQMPYGQEHFGGGDTYGPLFFALHVPFVMVWEPGYQTDEGFQVVREGIPEDVSYRRISFTAAKWVAGIFDALLLIGLVLIGSRRHNRAVGLSLALIYAVLPYTIDGLNFSSHIVATACTVWALVMIRRPILSGLCLAFGTGALFYPVFLLPLWTFYYKGQDRIRFILVVVVVGLICVGTVSIGESNVKEFWHNTWGQQEGAEKGGSSEFGFWGQHPQLQFLKRPVFYSYLIFCAGIAFWPKNKSEASLIALSTAVLLGTQLWKTHAGGTYIEWYLPWLIMTLAGLSSQQGEVLESTNDLALRETPLAD